jgi:hypothetical protein
MEFREYFDDEYCMPSRKETLNHGKAFVNQWAKKIKIGLEELVAE